MGQAVSNLVNRNTRNQIALYKKVTANFQRDDLIYFHQFLDEVIRIKNNLQA